MQKTKMTQQEHRSALVLNARAARTLLAGVARATRTDADRAAVLHELLGVRKGEQTIGLIERRLGVVIVPQDMIA